MSRRRVLLVDDSPDVLAMTAGFLRRRGMEVIAIDRPIGVRAKVRDLIPDVIVLDLNMPALDGTQLARLLQGKSDMDRIPIIFYSSTPPGDAKGLPSGLPSAAFVSKADGPAALLRSIEQVLAATS